LSDEDRSRWLELARKDRQRYEREKSEYRGPWKVPDIKDPECPKRPMSAYLFFSNERRKAFVEAHPEMTGTEISRALSALWHTCPEDIKNIYCAKEASAREKYKEERVAWENYQRDCAYSVASTSLDDSLASRCSTHEEMKSSNLPVTTTAKMPEMPLLFMPSTTPALSIDYRNYYGHMDALAPRESQDSTLLDSSNQNEIPHCYESSEKIDRFENFTLDDILESDELFEDFSPSLAMAVNSYGSSCGTSTFHNVLTSRWK
jgi:high mobility group protein B1